MALATSDHTRTIKLAGLMGNPAVATRVRLILSSEEEVETMRRHNEWAKSYLPGLCIEGAQWYPVKVDGVNKLTIQGRTHGELLPDVHARIGRENEISTQRARWL